MTLILTLLHLALWSTLLANAFYLRRERLPKGIAPTSRLSVLIPARNEAQNLKRLLPSLLEQDHPAFEIVVYDDASTDDTSAVLTSFDDNRLKVLRGEGPPPDWVGKTHALYQAARRAEGDAYLFLDADTFLHDSGALRRLALRFEALPEPSALTGLTRLEGGAKLLVSLVPNAILTALPWTLVRRTEIPSISALNGQCWMIDAETYHRHEPHRHRRGDVLEDVHIGRYLKSKGVVPEMVDVQREVSVEMYRSFSEAWQGFRKNAYLLFGGTPLRFVVLAILFLTVFILAPFVSPWFLLSIYGLKTATDRLAGFPVWISLLAPLSYAFAVALQWDSAFHHLTGRVTWKGRSVSGSD